MATKKKKSESLAKQIERDSGVGAKALKRKVAKKLHPFMKKGASK